jgi:hypothetical protein
MEKAGLSFMVRNGQMDGIEQPGNTTIIQGTRQESNLYKMHVEPQRAASDISLAAQPNTGALPQGVTRRPWTEWHKALGHINYPALQYLHQAGMVTGFEAPKEAPEATTCKACIQAKSHEKTVPKETVSRSHIKTCNTNRCFDLFRHTDLSYPSISSDTSISSNTGTYEEPNGYVTPMIRLHCSNLCFRKDKHD